MIARTIASVSTPPGTSGVAVIRVSGPDAANVAVALAGTLPEPRRASLVTLRDPNHGEPLDRALALWFQGPSSFTGEDVLELQVHGGRAVVAAVLKAVLAVPGARPAEPGEFTRRAFENGRLDLSEVEGLGDLLQAETEAQRRQAYGLFSGRLTSEADRLQARLLPILAGVEATIDFPDEGDVTGAALAGARHDLAELAAEVDSLLAGAARGEKVRDGVIVAIAGPPNAGKSTLLNALARRDVAIVSPLAGTTRDSLEVHLDLGGVAVVLVDTAGLRETADPVEAEGIRRTRERMAGADLTLWLCADDSAEFFDDSRGDVWRIATQIDREGPIFAGADYLISALTGEGMAGLIDAIAAFAAARAGGEPAVVVHQRHRLIFEDAVSAMASALALPTWDDHPELVAERLRQGLAALGRSRGRVGTEAMLDRLFSAFCIGK
ncbi:MAG: tRNA uridine-5-carboxymethylaminomethyl(34) synthesis GTPase MnmE [Microcystis aeruginosa DA14]|uniref:tRNA modification GTPase MnmE n=1 Tax=Microcystis aeruginosa DA14 TaxID=1987506 RepID=A0A3E0MDV4_MICAE|nr:MAG: tRNA uridine-5-carboxymethylaminomethyl(34) synthesis GTPase MnmE [Microcystis aeruginosa DA14]